MNYKAGWTIWQKPSPRLKWKQEKLEWGVIFFPAQQAGLVKSQCLPGVTPRTRESWSYPQRKRWLRHSETYASWGCCKALEACDLKVRRGWQLLPRRHGVTLNRNLRQSETERASKGWYLRSYFRHPPDPATHSRHLFSMDAEVQVSPSIFCFTRFWFGGKRALV